MSSPSIEQLQELPLPSSVSYVPQTWGWMVLSALLLLVCTAWAARKIYRWRQNSYRRQALSRLDQLQRETDNTALREVPELLKRVALSIPQQPDVAGLTGAGWQAFLQDSSPTPLPDDFAARLAILAYAPDATLQNLDPRTREEILRLSRQWVGAHRVAA